MPKCNRCGRDFIWGQSIYGRWVQKDNGGREHSCLVSPTSKRTDIENKYCKRCLQPMKSYVNKTMCRCIKPIYISKKDGVELLKIKVKDEEKEFRSRRKQQKEDEKLRECVMCGYNAVKIDNEIICIKDPEHHRVPFVK